MVLHRNFQNVIASLNMGLRPLKQHFINFNMVRHRNLQSVIGPLTLEAAFYSIFTFNFRFNRALISHSRACLLYTSDAADE